MSEQNSQIKASDTPLKAYSLICNKCSEPDCIMIAANDPQCLWCSNCEEDLDISEIRDLVNGWNEYLADLQAYIDIQESKDTELEKIAAKLEESEAPHE